MVAHPGTPPQPAPPSKPDRTWRLAGLVAAGVLAVAIVVVVVVVLAIRSSGSNYTYMDGLCEEVDISPVVEHFSVEGTDHGGGSGGGRVGSHVCGFDLDTEGYSSDLRITADVHPNRAWAREDYAGSEEFSRDHEFDTIEDVAGPWQEGRLLVGDIFGGSDYNVRLKALDGNLALQVDLIIAGPSAPTTYEADGELPLAVRQVAENAVDTLKR